MQHTHMQTHIHSLAFPTAAAFQSALLHPHKSATTCKHLSGKLYEATFSHKSVEHELAPRTVKISTHGNIHILLPTTYHACHNHAISWSILLYNFCVE